MSNLIKYISMFKNLKIGVFGDLMVDEFTYGNVNRISPEAPVPVLEVNFTEYRLGGCGNVACNIASFGSGVCLFGVVGNDPNKAVVSKLLDEYKIESCILVDKNRPTTKKNRIIAHKQQITRLDWENRKDIPKEIETAILEFAKIRINNFNAVVLSDYAKGFLTDKLCSSLISMANKAKKPVIVDPKSHFAKYSGSAVITPNLKEMQTYGKIIPGTPGQMMSQIKKTIAKNSFQRILVTMGEEGMGLFGPDGYSQIKAVKNGLDVIDITGAGDTAIAVFSMALASGASYEEAALLSNYAAGVVVSKFGTAVCSPEELESIIKDAGDVENDSHT
jgi:rfaE bifunctional protein kinase chain/domain